MAKTLLVGNGTLFTLGDPGQVIPDGGVLMEGSTIVEVGTTTTLRDRADEFIDARGRVIMPGLICAHHHLYSTFACGLAAEPAKDFVEVLEKLWWKLDRALDLEDCELSALIPLARCIRSGTTTLIDHHASPASIDGSLSVIGDAVLRSGLRTSLCYEVTDRNGPEGARAGIEENEAWLRRCAEDHSGRLHGLVGLHAAMTVGPESLAASIAVAQEYNSGLHVHVAESPADQEHSLATYGRRVIRRLADAGGLGADTLAVHCVHLDDEEVELLADSGTTVIHNPQSNMNNAVGCADVPGMLARGICVGLGTDGMTSNMLEEARASLFIRHHVADDPSAGFGETVQMLTNNAALASQFFGRELGVLAPGAAADVIVIDHLPFTPVVPDNVYGHLLFGAAAERVLTTICDGNVLMLDGELMTLDMDHICGRAVARSGKTWERFSGF